MNERAADHLRTAPLGKLMFSLALPSVLAQLVNLLYSIVDRVYIGHIPGIGAMALTGLGLCVPLITLVSAFAAFAGSGGAPQAAIQLGKGDREQAGKILSQAILLLLVFSAVLMAVLYLAKRPLLYFFGASDATIGYADDYISLYLVGTAFVLLTMGLNNFILCQGQAGTAMCSVLIGAVANIILDPVLIFLFGMGIRGAALATVISQALSAVWVLRFLLSERSVFPIRAKNFLPDGKVIAAISALGISPFVMQATESLVAIVFTSGLQKYGSDLYVGTYTILQSLLQLFFTPTHGFTYGVQSILSYNYGAKNYARVKRCFAFTTLIVFAFTLAFYLLIYLFPSFFAGLFTSDARLQALAAEKLPVFLFGMSIFGIQMSVQTAFLGLGQAKVSLFIACLRKVILLTPLALILPVFFGVDGIYYSEPISDFLCAIASLVIFIRKGRSLFHESDTMQRLQESGYRSALSGDDALSETEAGK